MKIAGETWALVVGIDRYADKAIPKLDGAVADAVAFLDWLRKLGVPDEHVHFHAAPIAETKRSVRGRKPLEATAPAINESVVALEKLAGKRLIVYLAGHGIFEPTSGRLFLVEEFTQDTPMNMDLDKYIRRFLAMSFDRQFLFMDGCQNLPYNPSKRQEINGQMYGGKNPGPPRPGNQLVACYAARQGELAHELNGRGAFTMRLFEAIDLDSPHRQGLFLDFLTGESFIDLRKAVTQYVGPCVQADVPGGTQRPNVQSSPDETDDLLPFVTFRSDRLPGKVTVQITPPAATPQVDTVRIGVRGESFWSFYEPQPPRAQVEAPFSVHVPVGVEITANCVLRRDAPWEGKLEEALEVQPDTAVTFELKPRSPAAPSVEVTTVDVTGSPVSYRFDYEDVGKDLGLVAGVAGAAFDVRELPAVHISPREVGPVFTPATRSVEDIVATRHYAARWARALQEATDGDVGVTTIVTGAPTEGLRPTLRFRMPDDGASALAGPITTAPVVWVGPVERAPARPLFGMQYLGGTHSLDELERAGAVEVEPGHVLVRIDLPWGSWSNVVEALPGGTCDIELPRSVGHPPLRVRLFSEVARKGSLLLGVEGRAPTPALSRGLYHRSSVSFRAVRPGSARWAFSASFRRGVVGVATAGSWSFPFLGGRSLAMQRTGGQVRIEPLSAVASPGWDLLLAGGLLDALSPDDATNLTYDKWQDPLLGLAGAYAVYALPERKRENMFLRTVLANLRRLSQGAGGLNVPDVDLLDIALTAQTREPIPDDARKAVERWATAGALPVLRWGVPLAVRLIEDGVLVGDRHERWHAELQKIEEALSPVSVWTAWRSRPRRGERR